jgi:hypothetical protein
MNYKKYILILAQLHSSKRAKISLDESEVTIDASSSMDNWEFSTPISNTGNRRVFEEFFGSCQNYRINSKGGMISSEEASFKLSQKTPKLTSFQSCKCFLQHFIQQAAHWKEVLESSNASSEC